MMRRSVLVIVGTALLLRLAYLGLVAGEANNLFLPDSVAYTMLSDAMLASGGFNHRTTDGFAPETERAPLYVAYLAAFRAFVGTDPLWPVLGQCVLDSLTCLLIGYLAAQFHRDLALIAGLLAACNLNLIVHAELILADSLFLLPFTAHLVMMVRFVQRPTAWGAFWAGVFFALALMTRSVLLYFAPVLTAAIVIISWRRDVGWERLGRAVVACLLPLLVLVGPLLIRNANEFGYFGLTSQGGTHSLFWVVPLAREFSRGVPFAQTQEEMRQQLDRHLKQQGLDGMTQNPFERSHQLMQVAELALKDMSLAELLRAWGAGAMINLTAPSLSSVPLISQMERPRFYETPGSTPLEKVWNFLSHAGSSSYLAWMIPAIVLTLAVRGVQVWGIFCRAGRRLIAGDALLYLLAVGLYILAITGPVVGVKYRLPLEPMLVVFAAAGLHCLFSGARGRSEHGQV